jgi:hypothetical protein
MTTYTDAMHSDASMIQSGGYHPYSNDCQQGGRHGDNAMIGYNQSYNSADVLTNNADYIPSNGYYAPPQAPRLSAAAARASSMAAMYYNPSLHPLHPLNGNVATMGPWTGTYRAGDYSQHSNLAPAFHHQQVEDQLMAQNHRGYGNVAGYSAAATAYGQEQRQPEQQQYAHRYSYPHDQSQRPWNQVQSIMPPSTSAWSYRDGQNAQSSDNYQRHRSDATPTGYPTFNQANRVQSYFDYSKQPAHTAEAATTSQSQALSLSGPNQIDRIGWTAPRDVSDSRGTHWAPGYAESTYRDACQAQADWNPGAEGSLWNRGQAEDIKVAQDQYGRPLQYYHQPNQAIAAAYQAQHSVYSNVQSKYVTQPDQGARINEARQEAVKDQTPAIEQPKAAPSPPSPDTLDKSAVPISSVGAEIIWSACVVFTEPEMLASCTQSQGREKRGRTPSSDSTPSFARDSPYWPETDRAKKSLQLHDHYERNYRSTPRSQALQRVTVKKGGEAAVSSEESSASSSEPGTPPSSFPLYMYEDANGLDSKQGNERSSYSASHGLRRTETLPLDATFSRDSSMPALERRGTQDRVHEAASSVLNLIPLDCQWSLHNEKFESLGQSLREAAKVHNDGMLSTIRKMRSLSANGTSLRSDETYSVNSATAPGSEPSPAFRRFAHQVLAQTLVSPTAFILAMMYALRVPHLAVQTNIDGVAELDAEAREIFAQPPSAAPFKLFTLGLMIANKHLDDNTFLNKTWNEVTGISLVEINRMERWYLEKCSYEIAVPEESWVAFLENLAMRTEKKLDTRRLSTKARSMSQQSNPFKTLGGLTHEEALQRMLLSVEEALVVLGRLAPFDLTRQLQLRSASPFSRQSHFTSASSGNIAATHSGNVLQSLHHNCRSAPALNQYHDVDSSNADVFGDDVGPYRPQGNSVRSHVAHERRSLDPFYNRSHSENNASLSWTRQQERPGLDAFRKASERGAPLAPSVLLELLNRGQQLAHTTHY